MHAHAAAAVCSSAALVDEWFGPLVDLAGEALTAGIAANAVRCAAKRQGLPFATVLRSALMRVPATTTTPALLRVCCGQGSVRPLALRVARQSVVAGVLGFALKPLPGAGMALRVARAAMAGRRAFIAVRALETAADSLNGWYTQSDGPAVSSVWTPTSHQGLGIRHHVKGGADHVVGQAMAAGTRSGR